MHKITNNTLFFSQISRALAPVKNTGRALACLIASIFITAAFPGCSGCNGSGSGNTDLLLLSLLGPNNSVNWNYPEDLTDNISPDGQNGVLPKVAKDNDDNTLIVWIQSDENHNQLFMSEYRGGVWDHPDDLSDNLSPDGTTASSLQVAMNDQGEAIIVWKQSDGSNSQIYMSEYRSGSWTHPTSLEDDHISMDGQNAVAPQVAMENNGNAIIVWQQSDGSRSQIFMSEYRGGVWDHPDDLSDNISPDDTHAAEPMVAISDNGNAIIAWEQSDGSRSQIFMSEYRGGVWDHPDDLSDNISPDETLAKYHQVAMDDEGNTIIVWQQNYGSYSQIYMSEYRNGAWTHPTSLENDHINPDGYDALSPQVAMDNNGNAIIAWSQIGISYIGLYKSEYRDGAWTHPTSLEDDNINPIGTSPGPRHIAMDDNGNAIIVWEQSDGSTSQVFLSEYRGGVWNHPDDLSDNISPDGYTAQYPQVAMNDNGEAIIVWQQSDGLNTQIFKGEIR